MPVLMGDEADMQVGTISGSGFNYSGKRIEGLEATEYTLVTLALDETGSTSGFEQLLMQCISACVAGCKLSPRSENIMVRILYFGTQYPNGVEEIIGFKPVNEIDPSTVKPIRPRGSTTLNDAVFSAVGATNDYGEDLRAKDYNCNGICFVVTDGGENASTATVRMVKEQLLDAVRGEKVESMISILVGVNAKQYQRTLEKYQQDTGMTSYIDAGDLDAKSAAKLADFVSKSVSSQSQSIGTGGPSQNITASI